MEQIYLNLQKEIGLLCPEIMHVNEDVGQLECGNPDEAGFQLSYPAVLINVADVNWSDAAAGQKGEVTISVKLAIDAYSSSMYGATDETRLLERMELFKKVHESIHKKKPGTIMPIVRYKSRFYSIEGGIKVYESLYKTTFKE